ncbi:MAG: hypothetical protein E6778_07435 [Niallia nealsonii]|nr:hypothetical protein [Niallia nealsonii]
MSWLKPTMPSSVNCKTCNKETMIRICPSCRSTLPSTISDYEDYIIAIIGAKQSGKSHYIAVLIDEIINNIGNAYNCYLKPENEETIQRYNRQFKNPLFQNKTTLDVTQSARVNGDVKKPLLFTLSFSNGGMFGTKVITLAFFDAAGEDLKEEKNMSKHTRYISNSAGIICLLDPLQLPSVRDQIGEQGVQVNLPHLDLDNDVNDILIRTTNMIRNTLGIKMKKKINIPIAISFSKIDGILPLIDPSSKLKMKSRHLEQKAFNVLDFQSVNNEMKSLVQGWTKGNMTALLDHNYKEYGFFGISALGSDPGLDRKITNIEPYRVEDPFLWLLWKNKIIKGMDKRR